MPVAAATLGLLLPFVPARATVWVVTTDATNDVLSLLQDTPLIVHSSSALAAVDVPRPGGGLMLLAGGYPFSPTDKIHL